MKLYLQKQIIRPIRLQAITSSPDLDSIIGLDKVEAEILQLSYIYKLYNLYVLAKAHCTDVTYNISIIVSPLDKDSNIAAPQLLSLAYFWESDYMTNISTTKITTIYYISKAPGQQTD